MLRKLASPKKAQAIGAGGEQQPASDQAASAKAKAKEKTKEKTKGKTKEDPQQASPSKSETGDAKERAPAEGSQFNDAAEDKLATPAATSKSTGRRKTEPKKPKKERTAHETGAIQEEEEGESKQAEAQENQEGGVSSDAKSNTSRGFLKAFTQATRGEQASKSRAKQQNSKEPKGEQGSGRTRSSPPTKQKPKQQEERNDKRGRHRGSGDKNDDSSRGDAGEDNRNDRQPKESAATLGGNLSPIRRRPPPLLEATDAATTRARALANQFAPLSQPEVHLVGEVVAGGGFADSSGDGLLCKWHVEFGGGWRHIAGLQLGQTQIAYASPAVGVDGCQDDRLAAVWAHPIDVHLTTSAFQGWPKLVLQVWRVDTHMSMRVAGYGFVAVPFAAGEHELRVRLWRPTGGSWMHELGARLMGNTPELVTDDVVVQSAIADRCRLETVATGSVSVRIGVLLRNFDSLRSGQAG